MDQRQEFRPDLAHEQYLMMTQDPRLLELCEISGRFKTRENLHRVLLMEQLVAGLHVLVGKELLTQGFQSEIAMSVANEPYLKTEFVRVLLQQLLRQHGDAIWKLLTMRKKFENHIDKVQSFLRKNFRQFVADVLGGREPPGLERQDSGNLERILLKLYENQKLQDHFKKLMDERQMIMQPMTREHIGPVGDLYDYFQFDEYSLVNLASGEDVNEIFLWDYEDEEEKTFHHLFDNAERLEREGRDARELATIEGTVMVSAMNPKETLTAFVRMVSPRNPDKDPWYYAKMEDRVTRGVSGGGIYFGDSRENMYFTSHHLRMPTSHILLALTKEPGSMKAAMAHTFQRSIVKPQEVCFTYTADTIELFLDGQPLNVKEGCGQNARFLSLAPKTGMVITNIRDHNPHGPIKEYTVPSRKRDVKIGARFRWKHLYAEEGTMRQKTAPAAM